LKNKIVTNGIKSKKCKFAFVALICIFSLITVSAAASSGKCPWIASIQKSGESIIFADHDNSTDEGGWIQLCGGKQIQLPQPLSFTYYGPNSVTKLNTTVKVYSSSLNTTGLTYTYPYSTHPFYTENQNVTMDYNGPSVFKCRNVDIYLVKLNTTRSAGKALMNLVANGDIKLDDVINNSVDSYTKTESKLDENGDLAETITYKGLKSGSYGIIATLADNNNTHIKAKVLSATGFMVLKHDLKASADDTVKQGDDLDVCLCLKDAPTEKGITYAAVLINKDAYKAEVNLSSNGTIAGTDAYVNGIDLRDLGINSTNYKSKLNKNELASVMQTFVGEGNGTISIGDKDQNKLSLAAFDLNSGDYLLFTGAYEQGKGLVGIDQKELTICK